MVGIIDEDVIARSLTIKQFLKTKFLAALGMTDWEFS